MAGGPQEIDWDRLDKKKFFVVGVGLFSGVTTALYPLTVIKTRQMAAHTDVAAGLAGTKQVAQQIWRHEGVRGFYRGFGTVVFGTIPARSVYLTTLEVTKAAVARVGERFDISSPALAGAASFVGGAAASASTQAVVVPIDVISQRLMMQGAAVPSSSSTNTSSGGSSSSSSGGRPVPAAGPTAAAAVAPAAANEAAAAAAAPSSTTQPGHSSSSSSSSSGSRGLHTAAAAHTHAPQQQQQHSAAVSQQQPMQQQPMQQQQRQYHAGSSSSWSSQQQQQPPWHQQQHVQQQQLYRRAMRQLSSTAAVQPMNGIQMARLIVAQEGVGGLYRGFWPSLATFVPSSAVWWGAYGFWQRLLWEQLPHSLTQPTRASGGSSGSGSGGRSSGPDTGVVVAVQTASAVLSGCTASVLTNPLDLVKTRLQVAVPVNGKVPTWSSLLYELLAEEGVRGLMRGVAPRMASSAMWGTAMVSVYEFLKRLCAQPAP